MPCDITYITPEQRERMRLEAEELALQRRRDQSFAKLEAALGAGTVQIEQDPITGEVTFLGLSPDMHPEGMHDLCVLDALQQRASMEFQLALGSIQQDFTKAHAYAHAHGIPHSHGHSHKH